MVLSDSDDVLARRFPRDFEFGVATSAYQIEGAVELDGRKPSIWDAFSHMPGRILNGDVGDTACDHYHRFREDLALAASLGVDTYRFSVAWPRVIPDGEGAINIKGLDFYDKLIDTALARGLKPHMTLHHWDLPMGSQGWGGWTARRTAYAFADFTTVVMDRVGDRVSAVTTINEPWCVSILSHLIGRHAPGERNLEAALRAVHVVNLAHGLAVDAARVVRPDVPIGIVMNSEAISPASDRPEDVAAARRRHLFHNGLFCGPILGGAYPEEAVEALGSIFPEIEDGDLEIISRPIDFLGINYYQPTRVVDQPGAPYPAAEWGPVPEGRPVTAMGWEIDASGLGRLIDLLSADWELPPIWITENGGAFPDPPGEDGRVHDLDRIEFMRSHLAEVADLIARGVDIRGYFAWTLMDNFEWANGYSCRFGLTHVNFEDRVRKLKDSGAWYREFLRRRRAALG